VDRDRRSHQPSRVGARVLLVVGMRGHSRHRAGWVLTHIGEYGSVVRSPQGIDTIAGGNAPGKCEPVLVFELSTYISSTHPPTL
jgi:hypothetical protein